MTYAEAAATKGPRPPESESPERLAPVLPLSRALGRRRLPPVRHLVWGWGGVLFDDAGAGLAAINAALLPYGMPPLSLREFRNVHTHPSADCYTMLFGRQLAGAEVAWLDRIVRGQYRRFAPSCGLAEDAEWALRDWSRIPGRGQSLLSLRPEHWLAGQVHRLGVAQQFDRVEGLRLLESTDTGKAPLLGEHLEALDVDPAETLLIGDGTDDAEAARLVGCRAVLCSGGWQSRRVLRSTGFPVAGGVREAVELASTRAEQG